MKSYHLSFISYNKYINIMAGTQAWSEAADNASEKNENIFFMVSARSGMNEMLS